VLEASLALAELRNEMLSALTRRRQAIKAANAALP
jgi:hypothetical protein